MEPDAFLFKIRAVARHIPTLTGRRDIATGGAHGYCVRGNTTGTGRTHTVVVAVAVVAVRPLSG